MNLHDIAERIKADIDAHCVERFADKKPRRHLGASVIGANCLRALWYSFRWAKQEEFDGQMLRLFQRGHREEVFITEYLEALGFKKTAMPHRDYGNAHYGGTPDGHVGIVEKYFPHPMLVEFKTWNTKGFVALKKVGVQQHAPKHFAQMSVYGWAYEVSHALYIAVNKNDDDLHIELIELDMDLAEDNFRKAQHIVETQIPPKRIADHPSHFECRYCTHNSICHYEANPDRNCRSCRFARADTNGTWFCENFNDTIPDEYIINGCEHWQKIT